MKTISTGIVALTLLIFSSCDNPIYRESISPIINTDLPDSCQVGEKITFKVYHAVFNGCGEYSRSETTTDGRTVVVKFFGKYPNGRTCTTNIPTRETNYSFKAESKGDYYFKFYQDNFSGQEYLLDTLRVQ